MYSYLALLSDRFFVEHMAQDKLKMQVKGVAPVKYFLFFLDNDVMYHLVSLSAVINRVGWFLIFYCIYFNLVWVGYVVYHSYKYIKIGD